MDNFAQKVQDLVEAVKDLDDISSPEISSDEELYSEDLEDELDDVIIPLDYDEEERGIIAS